MTVIPTGNIIPEGSVVYQDSSGRLIYPCGDGLNNGYTQTIGTSTGDDYTLAPSNIPLNYTINFTHSEPDEPKPTTIPKCYECKKEVESMNTYEKDGFLIAIMHCHGEERRIDISLKRFKGCKDDALEWFADTFDWLFDEEPKWRNVQPDEKVSTVHADRQIITDWLEKKS